MAITKHKKLPLAIFSEIEPGAKHHLFQTKESGPDDNHGNDYPKSTKAADKNMKKEFNAEKIELKRESHGNGKVIDPSEAIINEFMNKYNAQGEGQHRVVDSLNNVSRAYQQDIRSPDMKPSTNDARKNVYDDIGATERALKRDKKEVEHNNVLGHSEVAGINQTRYENHRAFEKMDKILSQQNLSALQDSTSHGSVPVHDATIATPVTTPAAPAQPPTPAKGPGGK